MVDTPTVAKQRKPVAVLYGASTQHTRAISERIAESLIESGFPTENRNLQGLAGFELNRCVAAVLVAPVHQGKHEEALVDFVKTHRAELDRLPVAFISATIEASAQPPPDAPESRGQFEGDVQMAPNPFFAETGWHPKRLKSFAGAVSYMQYNFFVRTAMWLLAKTGAAGRGGGARQEAGWDALDVFVKEFAREIRAEASQPAGD